MNNSKSIKMILVIGIITLFIVSTITPMVIGYNVKASNREMIIEDYDYDRYLLPEFYDCYNIDEISNSEQHFTYKESNNYDNFKLDGATNPKKPTQPLNGPMNSPWPMHGHDVRHTGRSPYSTVDTWDEVWQFETKGWALGSPAVDNDGTIYIGSWYFYAVYPNGSLKWKYDTGDTIEACCPSIDENGVIYVGTSSHGGYLHAVNPDGTLKWKYPANSYIVASPAIGDDGIIYFAGGDSYPESGHITALYPNGTLKWSYQTNHVMYSSPAIGLDGSIYCGSHDNHVYALHPDGTLKWKYDTGSWVHGSPTIGDDGTVYIGSDNGHLYAFYPNNGTVKWKVDIGAVYGSPALDEEGNLYVGSWDEKFYAIYPNGAIKWSFNTGAHVWGSSAAISDEGTIYFGTCDLEWSGGIEIIALYSGGTD